MWISLGRHSIYLFVAFGRSGSGGVNEGDTSMAWDRSFNFPSSFSTKQQSPGRKEESISLAILLATIGIILRRVEVCPHTHGVDVLVLLVPSTIDDFHQTWVAVETFQLRVWDRSRLVSELIGG